MGWKSRGKNNQDFKPMKYSILMPYYRKRTLHNTFLSFSHHYKGREDYEVIVMEDHKNISEREEHGALLDIINSFSSRINIRHIETNFNGCYAPSRLFNTGARNANGDFFVLTNPECFHLTDVLKGFDLELTRDPNVYVVAACINASYNGIINKFEDFKYEAIIWYQHSRHNNRRLHFCSVISKKLYNKIGGFDEAYAGGFQYDDNDFLRTIFANNIAVITKDDLIVVHMKHGYGHIPSKKALCKINKQYYANKWRGGSVQ